jgi:hypothetical protein
MKKMIEVRSIESGKKKVLRIRVTGVDHQTGTENAEEADHLQLAAEDVHGQTIVTMITVGIENTIALKIDLIPVIVDDIN